MVGVGRGAVKSCWFWPWTKGESEGGMGAAVLSTLGRGVAGAGSSLGDTVGQCRGVSSRGPALATELQRVAR